MFHIFTFIEMSYQMIHQMVHLHVELSPQNTSSILKM